MVMGMKLMYIRLEVYNTGRDQMIFRWIWFMYRFYRSLFTQKGSYCKSKIRIMAATGNRDWPSAKGAMLTTVLTMATLMVQDISRRYF